MTKVIRLLPSFCFRLKGTKILSEKLIKYDNYHLINSHQPIHFRTNSFLYYLTIIFLGDLYA